MVDSNFLLTIIQFSHTRSGCGRYIWLIFCGETHKFFDLADLTIFHLFYFSIIYVHVPFNKIKMVCINFSWTSTQFSHTRSAFSRRTFFRFHLHFLLWPFCHIQSSHFSTIHANVPQNKSRMVHINFLYISLIFSGVTLLLLDLAILTLSKQYNIIFLNNT